MACQWGISGGDLYASGVDLQEAFSGGPVAVSATICTATLGFGQPQQGRLEAINIYNEASFNLDPSR